jgi:N-acetylglucosamine kinase-like BadF-type ATPase
MANIYKEGIKGVASLSRLVVKAYELNDEVAKEIIDTRVERLAKVILDNTKEISSLIKVRLFGGIFENNDFIVEKLKSFLNENYEVKVTRSKTIYGAVLLSLRLFKGYVDEAFYSIFDKEYKGMNL